MRRIDAIALTLVFFLLGGLAYIVLQWLGIGKMNAGIWSQVVLITALLVWLGSYLLRVVTKNMTYDQQLENYKTAVLKKRLEEMSPEEIARLQAEVAAEKQERLSDS
ncbi:DUF3007 family protein [Pseudanabaena sp. PCC 6802]|uniref:DUF3007 family protein n=1 Tax=Pseudanabaena sp. PCC 6802 TaxID=118173 RepID=UPI00034C1F0B|nr:DUF3007 family protein [Pseudanabaena sp. PCC 6802]